MSSNYPIVTFYKKFSMLYVRRSSGKKRIFSLILSFCFYGIACSFFADCTFFCLYHKRIVSIEMFNELKVFGASFQRPSKIKLSEKNTNQSKFTIWRAIQTAQTKFISNMIKLWSWSDAELCVYDGL